MGIPVGDLDFSEDIKLKVRTLNTDDDLFIYEKSAAEASSDLGRFSLIRVYSLCLMLIEFGGVNIYEGIFDDPSMLGPESDRQREDICRIFGGMIRNLDRRLVRYLFKRCWAWAEAEALKVVKDSSVEDFLTPDELVLYRDLEQSMALESMVRSSQGGFKDEQALQEATDRLEQDSPELDLQDLI